MDKNTLLLLIVSVPTLLAFLLPLLGIFSKALRNLCALALVLFPLFACLVLIPFVCSGKVLTFDIAFPLGFNFALSADVLSVFVAAVSSLISAIIIVYSFGYISHYEHQSEYYSMVVLFLGAMMGVVFSANLIFLYMFWEITAFTSWRLIGFFREKFQVSRADKAFMVTFFGALVMLMGFIRLYQETGSFDLSVIREALRGGVVSNITLGLILVGILSKSATLPFHTWLPDAGVAPSSVTALLHAAVLVKIGVYVFARLFIATFNYSQFWHTAVLAIAASSALVAAAGALIDTDIKRLIAYSTISQIGFIFLGFAAGTQIGITGALLYILMHGLGKAGLFLCAGIIEQNTKTKDITKMGGLIKTMPITAISFLFCAFSVMGIPPFGGFFSKYMVMTGAIGAYPLVFPLLFLVGACVTILYLFRVFNLVFLGEMHALDAKEGSAVMVASVAGLAILSLAAGIFIHIPSLMAKIAAVQMMQVTLK